MGLVRRFDSGCVNGRKQLLAVGLITLVLGCAASPGPTPRERVSVYKPLGSVQCEPASGVTIAALKSQLEAADIKVLGSSCGSDGRIYPAVCGASNGRIGIFEIPPTQTKKIAALGFAPLSGLPDATRSACP